MQKYIELSEDYDIDGMNWEIQFINGRESWGTQFMEFAEYCSKYIPNHKIPTIRQFFEFFEQKDLDKNIIIEFWENEEYFEYDGDHLKLDYKTCKKEMMFIYHKSIDFEEFLDRIEDYLDNDTLFIDFPLFCGYNAGIVGYSNWAYYVAPQNVNDSFVRDLWKGYNFYNITVYDEKMDSLDCIGGFYITNSDDLLDAITCNFGIKEEDIRLIDNESSRNFNFKTYEPRPVKYEFVEVK